MPQPLRDPDVSLSLDLLTWEEPIPALEWMNNLSRWAPMTSWVMLDALVRMVGSGPDWRFLVVQEVADPFAADGHLYAQTLGSQAAGLAVEIGEFRPPDSEDLWRLGTVGGATRPQVNVHSDPQLTLIVQRNEVLAPGVALGGLIAWLADHEVSPGLQRQRVYY
ncbi:MULTISPECIES: hypothetical protein [unclassified Cryobacterium]|uniref:hypothetical protein n=1 Tax=unclassified Cryobacterium TaxID=2649013 RepID=UPI00106B3ED1|nr:MULTISPECIES: hypothetical protein [unclassified Cryobacterium]TFB96261.1 hypothetical protein E3O39_09145 [Cryobacterium sp. MDB2-A-1]TFC12546.1 hypothetical protein E3O35_06310 [Cryobacterium sp. MDB2-A-2]